MSKDKTLEIKESRVRELANECTDYKKAMQVLFPEAFEENEGRKDITANITWEMVDGYLHGFVDSLTAPLLRAKIVDYCPEWGISRDGGVHVGEKGKWWLQKNGDKIKVFQQT